MKLEKLQTPKHTVTILVVIAIVIVSIVFVNKGLGADQLKEDLMGSWYQADEYNCATIEVVEHGSQIANKNYRVEYQDDVIEGGLSDNYKIKFVNATTLKIEARYDESTMIKHTVHFSEDKNIITISPAIRDDDPETSESWYRGNPDPELLTEIAYNVEERQTRREAREKAEEMEELYAPENQFGVLTLMNVTGGTNGEGYYVKGTICNNSSSIIENIGIEVDFSDGSTRNATLCYIGKSLGAGDSMIFSEEFYVNKYIYDDTARVNGAKITSYRIRGKAGYVDLS